MFTFQFWRFIYLFTSPYDFKFTISVKLLSHTKRLGVFIENGKCVHNCFFLERIDKNLLALLILCQHTIVDKLFVYFFSFLIFNLVITNKTHSRKI